MVDSKWLIDSNCLLIRSNPIHINNLNLIIKVETVAKLSTTLIQYAITSFIIILTYIKTKLNRLFYNVGIII